MAEIPYIGFGNEQLENAQNIGEGDFATCPKCKTLVKIKNSLTVKKIGWQELMENICRILDLHVVERLIQKILEDKEI